jgi:hypothetical protein
MRSRRLVPYLVVGAVLVGAPLAGSSPGRISACSLPPPSSTGGTVSAMYCDATGQYLPTVDYLQFTLSGANVKLRPGTPNQYDGTLAGKVITLSGQMSVTIAKGYVSDVGMSARMATKSLKLFGGRVTGQTVTRPFKLQFTLGKDATEPASGGTYVSGEARLDICGGVCAGYSIGFIITFKKPPSPSSTTTTTTPAKPPPTKLDHPLVTTYPVEKPFPLRPGTIAWLPYSVRDSSGKAKVHAGLYEGGTLRVEWASKYFLAADGRRQLWKVHLQTTLKGPLFFCVWAENPSGKTSANPKKSHCTMLSFLVEIKRVSNACGGEWFAVFDWVENYFGNVHTYYDPVTRKTYQVDFTDACDLHDAGYGGMTVEDTINGDKKGDPPIDTHTWQRTKIDNKFWDDMKKLCDDRIPEEAYEARDKCKGGGGPASIGAQSLFRAVQCLGNRFYDADLTEPGTQQHGGVGANPKEGVRVNNPPPFGSSLSCARHWGLVH